MEETSGKKIIMLSKLPCLKFSIQKLVEKSTSKVKNTGQLATFGAKIKFVLGNLGFFKRRL